MDLRRVVVAGASLAGLRAIEALRQEGFSGEIVALSAESHMPYDRPPLSKQYLKGEWADERISLLRGDDPHLDVDWRLGCTATGLDAAARRIRYESEAGAGELAFDGLVIATGSRPRRLPFEGDRAGIHVLRSRDDADRLRADLPEGARLVVIGGGFIGMEVAASARQMGVDVTVVEALPSPLLRGLGAELGELVAARHREAGVDVRCNTGVAGFEGEARVSGVRLSDGSLLPADAVLVGIGVTPDCHWLEGSGLELDDGVVCDARGYTGVEGIVACGDVARWTNPLEARARRYEHWTAAVEQGTRAARRLWLGADAVEDFAHVPYVWSDQYELRIAIAGEVVEGDTRALCHGSLEEGRFLMLFGHDGRLTGAVGFKRPRQLNACRDLIAARTGWRQALAANGIEA